MSQLNLFGGEKLTLKERFDRFHSRNPHVYRAIIKMAQSARAKGMKRIGMQMIFEVLRWNRMMKTQGDEYKLSNDYAAFYSRKAMAEYPELDGLFVTRG